MSTEAAAIQKLIHQAGDGETITLPEGRIEGPLILPRGIRLVGAGADRTILDAGGRGPVLAIDARREDVFVQGVTITGGKSRAGGGVSIDNGARVTLTGCTIEKNVAPNGRGGGLAVDKGSVTLVDCRVHDNRAPQGGALYVGGDASAELRSCMVTQNSAERGGALVVIEGAEVNVHDTRLDENLADKKGHHLYTYGTPSRQPKIRLENVTFGTVSAEGASVVNDSDHAAQIVLEGTEWPDDSANTKPKRRNLSLH